MGIERIPILQLQPCDNLRKETQGYLAGLSVEEVEKIKSLPQVWDIADFKIISDGNNRIAYCAGQGASDVLVEYNGPCPERFLFILEEYVERAKNLRANGIFTPLDLVKKYERVLNP